MANFLMEKVGPIPVWGWLAAATVVILFYVSKKTGAGSSGTPSPASPAAESPVSSGYGGGGTYGSGYGSFSGNGLSSGATFDTAPASSIASSFVPSDTSGGGSFSSAPASTIADNSVPATMPSPAPPATAPTAAAPVPQSVPSSSVHSSAPVSWHNHYTVKVGDTLASVAAKFNVSVAELAHHNVYVPGEVAGNAKVGQTLGTGAGLKTGQVLVVP